MEINIIYILKVFYILILGYNSSVYMSEKVDVKILEQGDIFLFFRPKVSSKDIKSIEDVRRFYMVLSPEDEQKIIDNTNNDANSNKKKL